MSNMKKIRKGRKSKRKGRCLKKGCSEIHVGKIWGLRRGKKRSSEFLTDKIVDFGVKFLKKVVLKFFGQMCSDEFFLKHALPFNKKIFNYRRLNLGLP